MEWGRVVIVGEGGAHGAILLGLTRCEVVYVERYKVAFFVRGRRDAREVEGRGRRADEEGSCNSCAKVMCAVFHVGGWTDVLWLRSRCTGRSRREPKGKSIIFQRAYRTNP